MDTERIYKLINDLASEHTRQQALFELSSKRDEIADLAILLWYSFGSITVLLNEIVSVYPNMHLTISGAQSNRVCNALALLQCIASHQETRTQFLEANIPSYLYPFLQISNQCKTSDKTFEYLRLTSLGVIGALVKSDEQSVIAFLLATELIPLCLKIMENGTDLSKTVATFILQKILTDKDGRDYVCQTYGRFHHVADVLAKLIEQVAQGLSSRPLKHVIRCYLGLSENPRAKQALRMILPEQLRDNTFASLLNEDRSTRQILNQLLGFLDTHDN